MLSAGIRELKNNLSRYLGRVKRGEDVLITDRGKVIARIIAENPKKVALMQELKSMVSEGTGLMPTTDLRGNVIKRVLVKGRPVSEIVIEDRR